MQRLHGNTVVKCVCICIMLLWTAAFTAAEPDTANTASDSATFEDFKQDMKKFGSDIKEGLSAAGESVKNWASEQQQQNTDTGDSVQTDTSPQGSLRELAYVQEIKKDEQLLYLLYSNGKSAVLAVNDNTVVRIRETEEGLLYPFTDGKKGSFKTIRKGDWILFSYTVSAYFKSVLPGNTKSLSAVSIDSLR